ncbi:MAG TPA: MarR family transcriptional regulator, partial [Cyanobacteria bacterium UBA9273]|nr:MarR family transcriptional regulator [Cyanobacteria bacterium UBA9273]
MTPNLDESHNAVWRLFLTTQALLLDRIEQELAEAELPPLTWYDVLWALESSPDRHLRLHELAEAIVLNRSNLTRLIDRLEAAGLVCRKSCPQDRRGAFAAITEEGLAMRQRMWQVYGVAIAKYFANYVSDAEVVVLSQVLIRIREGMRDEG